ncbi:egalitarian protein homolog [Pararge aegeria]|uniref:Jg17829 protein n=2 Tax=Pararge aegeria TaxID=116150 RepID=A0A8S4SD92_9NEOP|nr:egalitarian protein homolog [Pararge aegeria]CAH2266279.1 jg17829 [Pararge aegeria aegeria]
MESMEYELARNLTLLFFVERLLDKGEPRTLHDLSCQFGAKGFTKEMRQIAGGSQSGLKKFLGQYPALFNIDGDYVDINTFQRHLSGAGASSNTDYIEEAKEYFAGKMIQYGDGTEVPIKSLLGHRSQASPQVRHISGQRIKEFKDFLLKHPDTFQIIEDNVVLVSENHTRENAHSNAEHFHNLPVANINTDTAQQLLDYVAQCIEAKGPVMVDQLFHLIVSRFPQEYWYQMFKTPADLSAFLKIFSDSFHVQSNLVTLISKPKIPVMYLNAKTKVKTDPPKQVVEEKPVSPVPPIAVSPIPSDGMRSPAHRILSPIESPRVQQANIANQTLKQRINSIVIKNLAENMVRDRVNNHLNARASEDTNGMASIRNNMMGEAWRHKVLQSATVIANVRECLTVIDSIMNNKRTTKSIVSFDCEGINLGLKGVLTLCQIATMNGEVYILDIMACPGMVVEGKIKELLESESVIKIIHDCRNDSVNLYNQFEITLKNVFDTQAAHAVLQLQQQCVPVYKVKNLSLNALCELYNAPMNPMKEQLKNVYRRDQRYWARRPLTKDMIIYAASDVLSLVNPAIYAYMSNNIRSDNQQLFEELSNEQVFMHIQPTEVKLRKRQRKINTEVGELKLKLAESTKNIVLSNREIRLLRYLELTEDEKEKLKGCHKISKKLEKLEAMGQDKDSDSDEDEKENEMASLESNPSDPISSPHSTQPPSLTESMQMMDEILSDTNMDKVEKINRLEAILSAVAPLSGELEDKFSQTMEQTLPLLKNKDWSNLSQILNIGDTGRKNCGCKCHNANFDDVKYNDLNETKKVEVGSQTLSTGDIVITRIHFREEDKLNERILDASPLSKRLGINNMS